MSYIPDEGPDTGNTARTFTDRAQTIGDNWPALSRAVIDFGAYKGRFVQEFYTSGLVTGGAIIEGVEQPAPVPGCVVVREQVSARKLGTIIRDWSLLQPTVLALSVLHHLPDWKKYVGVIERNAAFAFIETSHPDEVLPEAVAQDEAANIWSWCEKRGTVVGESKGWDGRFMRPTWRIDF